MINAILNIFNLKLQRIYPRPMINFIKNQKRGNLIGAEIGVFKGENATSILKNLDISKLYLIDNYESYDNFNRNEMQSYKYRMFQEMETYLSKIVFIEMDSVKASKEINEKLDFVYIDGSHDFNSVKKDIEIWSKKIKKSGIIGGHDFDANHLEVIDAVISFCYEKKLKLNVHKTDWWVILP